MTRLQHVKDRLDRYALWWDVSVVLGMFVAWELAAAIERRRTAR